jgi:peptidoglycan/xylan/chitin deacetylase (PgdA/CDA1 family)
MPIFDQGSSQLALRTSLGAGAAALICHTAPAVTARGPLTRLLTPRLAGVGRPGGVALTFDDGPDPQGTPAVLAALRDLGWSATFFLLGSQVLRYPELARGIVDAGHEVAVHGFEHRVHLTRGPRALLDDMRAAQTLVAEATGTSPRWFRPPYGVLTAGTLLAGRSLGLAPALWTAWGQDWLGRSGTVVAATVLRGLRDRGTILLHDSDCTSVPGSWRGTVDSLPILARELELRGWAARTLTDHLGG